MFGRDLFQFVDEQSQHLVVVHPGQEFIDFLLIQIRRQGEGFGACRSDFRVRCLGGRHRMRQENEQHAEYHP